MLSLAYISQQVAIYCGIGILGFGLVGNILNCVVFISLRTFRESPCGFYLIVMSLYNIGQLMTSVFSRVMITGFAIDWTQTSWLFCKLRTGILHLCTLSSFTCMCLATIDQYMVTCSRHQCQQYSTIRFAKVNCILISLIWLFHEIPAFISYNLIGTIGLATRTCTNINLAYQQYVTYVYFPILTGVLPLTITIVFGTLAYRNVRQIPYRTVPLVRRELDKQLTSMVLVQVGQTVIVTVPFVIISIMIRTMYFPYDSPVAKQLNFISGMTGYIYYLYFAVSVNREIASLMKIFLIMYLDSFFHLLRRLKTFQTAASSCFI